MTRDQAVLRCQVLNAGGELFHWLPVRQGDGGWWVARVPLPRSATRAPYTSAIEPPPVSPHPAPDHGPAEWRYAAGA